MAGNLKQLIVNADDFGESPFVNAAIMRAYLQGIVTSTSIMTTGASFDQAVSLAQANPDLRVGLHLVFIDNYSLLPHEDIPDLVDLQGRFPTSTVRTGFYWMAHPKIWKQIRMELRAQLERFLDTGLPLDHINGHYHFHIHPVIFHLLLEEIVDLKLVNLRLPIESIRPSLLIDHNDLYRKLGYILKFILISIYHRHQLTIRKYRTINGVYGLFQTGGISEDYLLSLLCRIPKGTYELYAHPRLDKQSGIQELKALTSPYVKQKILEQNIHLTTYSHIPIVQ